MLDLISLALIGVLAGAFTGIVPGIHPNTVIFTSIPFYLSTSMAFMSYAAFISGLSVSHTFHDFLPSIYMQAPDANTALSTMPGAEKAANGEGPEAFHSTLIGGIVSIVALILALPVLTLFLEDFYTFIEPFMAYIVAFFLFFLIFRNKFRPAIITAVLAGALGMISLNSSLGGQFILMPVFGGLFAVPAVISSLEKDFELPQQDFEAGFSGGRGGLAGLLSGLIAGTVPGVGAAGSTTFLSPLMDDGSEFLAGMGGVNTTDIVVSLLALLLIGKARSGASVALQSLSTPVRHEIFLLIGLSVFCAGISALLALRTERFFLKVIELVNFRKAGVAVLSIVCVLSFVLSGWFGVLTLATASFIGFYSLENSCRAACMAVLLVPSIAFFM
ncbi:MAG: tripartite tricarboxylate transporter permease [Candidatus Nanohalobium sp.]